MPDILGFSHWLALVIFGGPIGWAIAALWIAIGVWFVTRSESRGWIADCAFLFGWPIWWIWEEFP